MKIASRPLLARLKAEIFMLNKWTSYQAMSVELEVSYRTIKRDMDTVRDVLGFTLQFDRYTGLVRIVVPHHCPFCGSLCDLKSQLLTPNS